MHTLRNWMMTSRTFTVVVIVGVLIGGLGFIALGVVVGRNTFMTMQLSDVCPDYFSEEYAWVVDEDGKGMDSVAVELWDNSGFNKIYRTFTDSTGRFILFHDFGSFALHSMPFSYFLCVTVDGGTDTIRYTFEKHRVCHFRKIDGPDSIFCSARRRSTLMLRLENPFVVKCDSGMTHVPFNKVACTRKPPRKLLHDTLPYSNCLYSTLTIGGVNIPIAYITVAGLQSVGATGEILTQGIWYTVDYNGDKSLKDNPLKKVSSSKDNGADCFLGNCTFFDSLSINGKKMIFECGILGVMDKNPVFRYRRSDALKGVVKVSETEYSVIVWDAAATDYVDCKKVVFAVDYNNDGVFDIKDGSAELYKNLSGRVQLGHTCFSVDTIIDNGTRFFCSDVKIDSSNTPRLSATVGTWVQDVKGNIVKPFSLYKTCAANDYVMLYFFEGNSARMLQQPKIHALKELAEDQLENVVVVGVNRRVVGNEPCNYPVIHENRGWKGHMVGLFHNTQDEELICLDNSASIVYRGSIDDNAIKQIWTDAGKEYVIAQTLFQQHTRRLRVPVE